jgi:hypothetical protein
VKLNEPKVVGVPDKSPPLAKVIPFGKLPVMMAKEYDDVPLLLVSVWL